MKLYQLLLASFFTIGVFVTSQAIATTIAVVDVQKVMQGSKAAQHIKSQIKAKRDSYQASIKKQEDELRKANDKLVEQRSLLATEAFESKREEFKRKLLDVQRDVQKKRAQLDKSLQKSLATIQDSITGIIAELAKDKAFDIAIPRSQILYAGNTMDITSDVLNRLNKTLPKVSLK